MWRNSESYQLKSKSPLTFPVSVKTITPPTEKLSPNLIKLEAQTYCSYHVYGFALINVPSMSLL